MFYYEKIIGEKINSLLAIGYERGKSGIVIICKCDCGNIKKVNINNLKRGTPKSCGCLVKNKLYTTIHFKSEYNTYNAIKQRCYYTKNKYYLYYGGRGIKMCQRWLNGFDNFLNDMGRKPSKKHSIDRIDVNGDYCKENCRWADVREQSRNKRTSSVLEYNGIFKNKIDWAKELKTNTSSINWHLRHGKTFSEIIDYYSETLRRKKNYIYIKHNGMEKTKKDWAIFFGIRASTLQSKMDRESDFSKVFDFYIKKNKTNE